MSRYISNGTMGEMWMAENCERCVKDHAMSHVSDAEQEDGCEVILLMMLDQYPIEGLVRHEDRGWPSELQCTYFRPCNVGDCSTPTDYRPSSWVDLGEKP